MYHQHWSLVASPFAGDSGVRFYHESPMHEEALARLHFLVDQRRRLGILAGASGSGKSLTLAVFARRLKSQGAAVALIDVTGVSGGEWAWPLAAAWGVDVPADAPVHQLWQALAERIGRTRYDRLPVVALFDNVHAEDAALQTQMVRLAQLDRNPQTAFTLLLAAIPRQVQALDERLLETCELRADLAAWNAHEVGDYLEAALQRAGATGAIFTTEAVREIHRLSQGWPRRVAQLADLCLVAGAAQRVQWLDEDLIGAVYGELASV